MMSDPIVTLLHSDNPLERKKGIGAAAKTVDARYLKLLAQIYKSDPDPALRDIAKKAGIYITKNQPEPEAVPVPEPAPADDDSFVALRDDLMEDVTDEPEPLPMPDLLANDVLPQQMNGDAPSADDILAMVPQVALEDSKTNPELASIHYDTAFDMHVKGRDARAVLELATAFKLNPAYMEDATAIALASELTGKSGNDVAAYISNTENWQEMTERLGGIQSNPEDREWMRGFALWAVGGLGIVILFGAFLILLQSDQFITVATEVVENTLDGLFGGSIGELQSPE